MPRVPLTPMHIKELMFYERRRWDKIMIVYLQEIAGDPRCTPTQRLYALEQIGRIKAGQLKTPCCYYDLRKQ